MLYTNSGRATWLGRWNRYYSQSGSFVNLVSFSGGLASRHDQVLDGAQVHRAMRLDRYKPRSARWYVST